MSWKKITLLITCSSIVFTCGFFARGSFLDPWTNRVREGYYDRGVWIDKKTNVLQSYSISNTGKRHNSGCEYYNPKFKCSKWKGVACRICGG